VTSDFLDRRALLAGALAFSQLPPDAPELPLLHRWLDSGQGIGDIVGKGSAKADGEKG
jgi:hypothetical protein